MQFCLNFYSINRIRYTDFTWFVVVELLL